MSLLAPDAFLHEMKMKKIEKIENNENNRIINPAAMNAMREWK